MATLVRWVVRVVTAILAFLLFETGVAGIPDSIASQYAFLSSLNEEWLIRLAALVLGFILALAAIGPHRVQAWIRWAAPNQALSLDSPDANSQADSTPEISVQEWWRERIKEWRSVIHDFDLDRPDDRRRFLRTDAYSQMKECGLKPEVIKMFEAQRTLHVGNEARGDTAYQYTLLDEVARIEKERVLNAPEPATNQAAPGELKALCFHLADELDNLHKRYENDEQKIMAWAAGLSGSGFSDDDFDQKVASAQDENLMGTLDKYNSDLKGRLLDLYATLESQGWLGDGDRSRIENLNDPYQMRELALRLRDVGNKLP